MSTVPAFEYVALNTATTSSNPRWPILLFYSPKQFVNVTALCDFYSANFQYWSSCKFGKEIIKSWHDAFPHQSFLMYYYNNTMTEYVPDSVILNSANHLDGTYVHAYFLPFLMHWLDRSAVFAASEVVCKRNWLNDKIDDGQTELNKQDSPAKKTRRRYTSRKNVCAVYKLPSKSDYEYKLSFNKKAINNLLTKWPESVLIKQATYDSSKVKANDVCKQLGKVKTIKFKHDGCFKITDNSNIDEYWDIIKNLCAQGD